MYHYRTYPAPPAAEAREVKASDLCTQMDGLCRSLQGQVAAANKAAAVWEARCKELEGKLGGFSESLQVRFFVCCWEV